MLVFAVIGFLLGCLDLAISAPGREFDSGFQIIFNLTREDGIGDYYSATITLFAALLAWAVFARSCAEGLKARAWLWLAALLTYTSIDDGSRFHEGVGGAIHRYLYQHYPQVHWPAYMWQVIFAPVFGVMLLLGLYVGYKYMTTRYSKNMFFLGFGLLVFAVGMDAFEGFAKNNFAALAEIVSDAHPFNQHLIKVVEETIESFAYGLIVSSLLNHIAVVFPQWKFDFRN